MHTVTDVPREIGEHLTHLVAAQFTALRTVAGMSLKQVAEAAALHPSTVHLIEQGKRGITLATAARIARALDVRLSDLIAAAEDDLS